jgi:hypothetical protein
VPTVASYDCSRLATRYTSVRFHELCPPVPGEVRTADTVADSAVLRPQSDTTALPRNALPRGVSLADADEV